MACLKPRSGVADFGPGCIGPRPLPSRARLRKVPAIPSLMAVMGAVMTLASGIPVSPEALTPAWLTGVLGAGRADAARVTDVATTRIGVDQAFTGGSLHRIGLVWDRPDAGPASVVAKLSPDDPAMRALMRRANATEARFFRKLAAGGDLPVPRCHHAEADPATGDCAILLDDLTGHRRVTLAEGASPRDAAAAVAALAAVHAYWWNRSPLAPDPGPDLTLAACWPRYADRLARIVPDVALPDWLLNLGPRLAERLHSDDGPLTLLHRDPHVENMLFAADGRAVLLDWQFAGRGRGAMDVGYFLISSLAPDQRRATERGLVAQYHAALTAAGVKDYPPETCWQDYLRAVAGKLWLTVAATVAFDNAGVGKAAYRRHDLTRLIAFGEDHGIGEATFLAGAM